MAFYKLYKAWQVSPGEYIPTWEFVGEMHIPELNRWVLMSYKCPTRLTDIFQENPGLLERELFEGKSGSKYYRYRIVENATLHLILDPALIEFRSKAIKGLSWY